MTDDIRRCFSPRRVPAVLLATTIAMLSGVARSAQLPLSIVDDPVGRSLQESMIWADEGSGKLPTARFVAFRKKFTLPHGPAAATLRVFADVRYLCWINGRYVARGPARFNPLGPEYDTIDVGPFLKAGDNALALVVMAHASNGKMMQHAPCLTARLETTGPGGASNAGGAGTSVSADETWKCSGRTRYRPASVNWGNVGDNIDARDEDGDWTQPDYDDAKWEPAVRIDGRGWGSLTARRIPMLRETPLDAKPGNGRTLPATLRAGEKITFDVGRLSQAYTTLDLDADAGATFDIDFGPVSCHYTARAGRQAYVSSDTCGMKVVTFAVKSGRLTLYSFKPVELLYPFDCVGSFHCSDPLLDRVWAMCARSLQLYSEDAWVDCADRERTEWMDNDPPDFDVTRTAMAGPGAGGEHLYADPRLLEEMIRRTALTLQPDGWVKAHTCSDRFDIHALMEDRSCDWVEGTRRCYDSTGDAAPVREIWPAIVRQMKWFLDRRTPRGLVNAREWVVWGNPMGYVTCEGAGLNAFIYRALADAAYLGGAIGEAQQAAEYDRAAKALAASFDKVLWDEKDGTYFSAFYDATLDTRASAKERKLKLKVTDGLVEPTMFPALFALDQGIVLDARRPEVVAYLLAHRGQASRVMTFYYLFKQMYAANDLAMDKEVLDVTRQRWKGMADWGTSWEEFSGGSKAHCYGLFPGYFLSAYVLGVRVDGPVRDKRILIEPRLGDLESAEGTVVTEFGPASVSWKRKDGRLAFDVTIPNGTRATVRLGEGDAGTLELDGKPARANAQGRYATFMLDAGPHAGSLAVRAADIR